MIKYTSIPLDDFQLKLGSAGTGEDDKPLSPPLPPLTPGCSSFPEISSVALGGKVIAVSDDFFADVANLLKVEVKLSFYG